MFENGTSFTVIKSTPLGYYFITDTIYWDDDNYII